MLGNGIADPVAFIMGYVTGRRTDGERHAGREDERGASQ